MRKESESITCVLRQREPIHSEDRERRTVNKERWARCSNDKKPDKV